MPSSLPATIRLRAVLCGAVMLFPVGASATVMNANLVSLGGTTYRFDYRLINDGSLGPVAAIESFDIGFLEALVTGWTEIGASPDAWVEFSAPVFGDDLFGADLNQGSGIAVGDWADFSVSFDWSGAGLPGSQLFTIYDPTTYDILETGLTNAPSPATALLMAAPLVLMAVRRRRGLGRLGHDLHPQPSSPSTAAPKSGDAFADFGGTPRAEPVASLPTLRRPQAARRESGSARPQRGAIRAYRRGPFGHSPSRPPRLHNASQCRQRSCPPWHWIPASCRNDGPEGPPSYRGPRWAPAVVVLAGCRDPAPRKAISRPGPGCRSRRNDLPAPHLHPGPPGLAADQHPLQTI